MTAIVSRRGQITLPAALRKRLGIRPGDVVLMEERQNGVLFRPGIVLPFERFSDEQIAAWDAADVLDRDERERLRAALARTK